MNVYISGPISGLPDGNRDAFEGAAFQLRYHGFEAINPHEIGDAIPKHPEQISWADYMRADLKAMMDADALLSLDGWAGSRGALLELDICRQLGIPVFTNMSALLEFRTLAEAVKS
jgi:hypothetical protein